MELTWKETGFDYSIKSILQFAQEESNDFWMEPICFFYPQLKQETLVSLKEEQRAAYIQDVLAGVYEQNRTLLAEKRAAYQAHWDEHKKQITEAFSEAFDFNCEECFNDMTGNITLNPIAPRYLKEQSFDVFYKNSEKGALGMALHEITHFVWFAVWHRHFGDSESDYEIPHLKWILSEMVVEPIMRDNRLAALNPYFEPDYEKAARGENGCVYDCFYRMKVEGMPVLQTLYQMYRNEKILDFMEQSYGFCKAHEQEIRSQMEGVL